MRRVLESACYLAFSILFICVGCSQRDNSAKLDAISQKIDTLGQSEMTIWSNQEEILSNQVVICSQLQAQQLAISQMPDRATLNWMLNFYSTNVANLLCDQVTGSGKITLTNCYRIESAQYALQESLWKIDMESGGSEFILTNNIQEFYYVRGKVDDIGSDIRAIKEKLGIIY